MTDRIVSLECIAVFALVIGCFAAGCGGGFAGDNATSPSGKGIVKITVTTVGTRLDPDGYTAIVGDQQGRLALNDSATFTAVPRGQVLVRLTGVAVNCDGLTELALDQRVNIQPDVVTSVDFRVSCGQLVLVDAGHVNYSIQTPDRYATFAQFLRTNGYVVKLTQAQFNRDTLALADVFVIHNALSPQNATRWIQPILPAFSAAEIAVVRSWVEGGGSLFLISDHMPFAGAASTLAAAFGIQFHDGFALVETQVYPPKDCLLASEIQVFRRSDGTLASHAITNGRIPGERIDSVATFTGSAFEPVGGADPLLVFGRDAIQIYPVESWVFPASTPRRDVQGWRQGAALRFGQGRVAFFGDGTMFVDKICGADNRPNGMNHPIAAQNRQFLLNVLRWLDGEL